MKQPAIEIGKRRAGDLFACLLLCLLSARPGFVLAGTPGDEGPLRIQPGMPCEAVQYPYGWSHPERGPDGITWRWIEKLEGELVFDLASPPANQSVVIRAKPITAHQRIQNMGLFLNGRFIREWIMDERGNPGTYHADVPARHWRSKNNRLILRAGYLHSPDADPRRLGIAIKEITIAPQRTPTR